MFFRKGLLLICPLFIVFCLVFPAPVHAGSQSSFHQFSEKAYQSGADPDTYLTGEALSYLLDYPLSHESTHLTLNEMCSLLCTYLDSNGLALPPVSSQYLIKQSIRGYDSLVYCFQGGILGQSLAIQEYTAPVPLSRACLILSQLQDKATPNHFYQPVSSLPSNAADYAPSDTIMLGHSNVVGMWLNIADAMDYVGLDGISAREFSYSDELLFSFGATGTMAEALSRKQYETIYIMLGTNDLVYGRYSIDVYCSCLRGLIAQIQTLQPGAKLCLLGITPLGFYGDYLPDCFSRECISLFNQGQKSISREYGIAYIELFTPIASSDGFNRREYARDDGIHYHKEGYERMLSHILLHPMT